MRDDDVWHEVNAWIAGITATTVIRGWQSGVMPARPYIVSNFNGLVEVRAHEMDREFTRQTEGSIFTPVIEVEWRFSLHAYSETPTDVLRPIWSAIKINPVNRITSGKLTVHSVSQIRNLPDFQNEDWEPRAQMDMNVRGLTRDGIVIDTVETYEPFVIERM